MSFVINKEKPGEKNGNENNNNKNRVFWWFKLSDTKAGKADDVSLRKMDINIFDLFYFFYGLVMNSCHQIPFVKVSGRHKPSRNYLLFIYYAVPRTTLMMHFTKPITLPRLELFKSTKSRDIDTDTLKNS